MSCRNERKWRMSGLSWQFQICTPLSGLKPSNGCLCGQLRSNPAKCNIASFCTYHIYMYEHVIIINLCLLSSGAEHSYDLPPLVKGFNNHINHLIHSRLLLHNINAFPQRNSPSIFVRQNFPITRVSMAKAERRYKPYTPSVVCTYVQYIHTYIHAAGTDQGKPRGRVTSYQSVISKGLVLRMHVVMSPPLSPNEQRTLAGNRELYAKRPKDKAILSRL